MPVGKARRGNGFHSIIRRVSAVRGSLSFVVECHPAFNYARDFHQTDLTDRGACFRSPSLSLGLSASVALGRRNNGVHAEFVLNEGRTDRSRLEDARLVFEKMLTYANHLGLYAEETGPSGEALGNFPQAFTHLALISAAFNLDRALSGKN